MSKKIFRVLGYIICALLIVVCILLIVATSLFGAQKTVGIFGANVFIVDNDDIPSAPKGSAVLVQKGTSADLEEGKLVLYLKADEDDAPTLGYVKQLAARDGVYYITVSHKNSTYEFPEAKLVGRADYSSTFWGRFIGFIKTPIGIMMIAVLPCASLILYDIIRAAAANRPEPEVVPVVKNVEEKPPHTDIKLSVDTEGKALYAKDRSLKPLPKANDVLFNYSGRQRETKKEPSKNERPIIPLTDRKPNPATPKSETPDKTGRIFDVKLPSDAFDTSGSAKPTAEPKQRAEAPDRETVSVKTAELPAINKKAAGDAFFAQPSAGRQIAPQIGRQRRAQPPADEADDVRQAPAKPEKTAGKRSSRILASKSFDDLLSDDDDDAAYSRSRSDKAVDDILSGLNRRDN